MFVSQWDRLVCYLWIKEIICLCVSVVRSMLYMMEYFSRVFLLLPASLSSIVTVDQNSLKELTDWMDTPKGKLFYDAS